MADFKKAETLTSFNEGGYVNDKLDHGGETIFGISRKYHPNWAGWLLVDYVKVNKGTTAKIINYHANANPAMRSLVSRFYKANFWDVNQLDLFTDQQIANTVYDFGVNSGTARAAKFLQDVLEVAQDGMIGKKTIEALNSGSSKAIHTAYNCKRKAFYEHLATDKTQSKFLKSWLSRLKPYK